MIRIIACLTLLIVWSADASAQTRSSSGSGTSSSSSGRSTSSGATGSTSRGGTGTQSGTATGASGGLNLDAGGSAAINRDFGSGMVGTTETSGLVGNSQAGTQTTTQTPNFQQRNSSSRISSLNSRAKQVDVRGGVRLGFEIAPSGPRTFASAPLPQQVSKLSSTKKISDSVAVEMYEGGTAVITGTVPDAQQAKLLQMYMMLEPGVKTVENRTVIAAQ